MIHITNKEGQVISIHKSMVKSPSYTANYTRSQIDEKLAEKQDVLVSGENVKTVNGESLLGSGNIKINADLSDYYTKEETDQLINGIEVPTKTSELQNDSDFVNGTQLSAVESKIPSLEGYAKKTDIPDVSGFATKSEIPSLDGYATEQWVEGKGYLTEHQDISGLATKTELQEVESKIPTVPTNVSAFNNDAGYLTEHQSLSGYATESWVNQQGFAKETDIPTDYAKPSDITEAINSQEFKTINGESIKGSGNIEIKGGGDYLPLSGGTLTGHLTLGSITETAFKKVETIRSTNGQANGAAFYVNSDGTAAFFHKAYNGASATNDAILKFDATGLAFAKGGTRGTAATVYENVATENYVNNLVGDIESALAAIIG